MDKDFIKPKRWEGKPWSFKFRYMMANFPEIGLGSMMIFVLCPIFCAYQLYSGTHGRDLAIKKYKLLYTVVRDDDPAVPNIIQQKEYGREYFPK